MDTEVKTQKWTPGPWKLHDTWPDDVVDADGSLVVSAYGDYESPQTQANALLTSKAPEMAELLRRAHIELGSEHGTENSPHCSCPLCSEIEALLSTLEKI